MNSEKTVFIGVGIYNAGPYLEKAIRSILDQTYPHFKLLLADDVSSDNSPEICEKMAALDSRITYVRHTNNKGHINNFNFILEQASGDFFAWIGHDDILDPTFLETCLSQFTPQTDAVMTARSNISTEDIVLETIPTYTYHSWLETSWLRPFYLTAYTLRRDILFYSGVFRLASIQHTHKLESIGGQTIETDHLFMMKVLATLNVKRLSTVLYLCRSVVKPPLYFESEANRQSNRFRKSAVYQILKTIRKKLGLLGIVLRAFYAEFEHALTKFKRNGSFFIYLLKRRFLMMALIFILTLPFIMILSFFLLIPKFLVRINPKSAINRFS